MIKSDIESLYGSVRLGAMMYNPSIRACCWIRASQVFGRWFHPIARTMLLRGYGIDLGAGASIGFGLRLPHPTGIVIGAGSCIGSNFTIYQGATVGSLGGAYPTIGNSVTVYAGAVVVGAITVGDKAIIGALTYVDKDVSPSAKVVGVRNK